VYSGLNTLYPAAHDGVTFPKVTKGLPTNVPSLEKWPIYWKFYPSDLSPAEVIVFQQVVHEAVMEADGMVTMKKAGAECKKQLNDATVWV
jgi:hypothetical protein